MAVYNPVEISLYVRSYYDIQKLRIAHANRCRTVLEIETPETEEEESVENYGVGVPELLKAEKVLKDKIEISTKDHPIRVEFFNRVKGIGPILSGGLISMIQSRKQQFCLLKDGREKWMPHPDNFAKEELMEKVYEVVEKPFPEKVRASIECFDCISALTAYAGLHVIDGAAVRRKRGQQSNWNSLFKTLCWKVGISFMKCGGIYKGEYEVYRARQIALHPEMPKMQTHLRALRRCSKIFLANLWMFWREKEGLSVRSPYVGEKLGHEIKHYSEFFDREA